jgi:hypothetical protein
MIRNYFPILFGLLYFIPATIFSINPSYSKDSSITFFNHIQSLDIEIAHLEVNLDSLHGHKLSAREHPGQFSLTLNDGNIINLSAKVSIRGKFRRQRCAFPPIRLNFKKKELEKLGLSKQPDDYKLVTHCLDSEDGENLVWKEYLVYQLYQILTDHSYRVKVFPIVYKDTGTGNEIHNMAFLIEGNKELAERLDGELCDCLNAQANEIDPVLMEQMALFQYMIGNRDMEPRMLKNMKLIKRNAGGKMIPVAFDFDFAPFVHAPYAYPQIVDKRKIERIYLGFEENRSYMEDVFNTFLDKKEAFITLIQDFELLPNNEKRKCLNYIKAFYDELEKKSFQLNYKVE